ncbi:MAG: glycosyltransferase family 2 protein [Pirellulaceae bacterium]
MNRVLTALPVFNEKKTLNSVLDEVVAVGGDVLVVNDGSNDGTEWLLQHRKDVQVLHHDVNRGYGAALISAFEFAQQNDYDAIVTIDCDGQHTPALIQAFADDLVEKGADIVSGSRYLRQSDRTSVAPMERRRINFQITELLNARLGLAITDAFCGFKAYRVDAVSRMKLTEPGYAMPLELWVQAACEGLTIVERAVPLIYLDEKRSFGGNLDDGDVRLNYYLEVIENSLAALPDGCRK